IAGRARFNCQDHAFYFNGVLQFPAGDTWSEARGLNSAGKVVGQSGGRAFMWDGKLHELGGLSANQSDAFGINASGQVAGYSDTPEGGGRAVLWQNGKITDLGALPGGKASRALAINNSGDVVGSADTENGWHAFVYNKGKMQDLNDLIARDPECTLEEARAI